MTTNTRENRLEEFQIAGDEPFRRLIIAIQQDMLFINDLFQDSIITEFPNVPEFGGVLSTRKGAYEGMWTDANPSTPQWRRLRDGAIFTPGQTIPTTL